MKGSISQSLLLAAVSQRRHIDLRPPSFGPKIRKCFQVQYSSLVIAENTKIRSRMWEFAKFDTWHGTIGSTPLHLLLSWILVQTGEFHGRITLASVWLLLVKQWKSMWILLYWYECRLVPCTRTHRYSSIYISFVHMYNRIISDHNTHAHMLK